MSHSNSMELFREAPVPKAVFQNALPAMAAMLLCCWHISFIPRFLKKWYLEKDCSIRKKLVK